METIGKRIARLRRARELTQKEFAQRAGISWGYLRQLEAGRNVPGMDLCIKLADAFGITLDELIRGEAGPNALRAATSSTNEPVVAALEGVA